MAYATTAELEGRWRPLSASELSRASLLLDDASLRIAEMCRQAANPVTDTDDRLPLLGIVVCDVVKRVMQTPSDLPPVTTHQQMAGAYSEMLTYANPSGDFYLTAAEKQLLGINRRQRIGSIEPLIEPSVEVTEEWLAW